MLRAVGKLLAREKDIRIAGIFGSFAKGDIGAHSDVDVCVAGDSVLTSRRKTALMNELSLLAKREIDVIDLRSVSGPILKEALGGAIWVKKRDASLLAKIVMRQLLEEADFAPLYRWILKVRRERFFAE